MKNKRTLITIISFLAIVVVIGSRAYIRSSRAKQEQLRKEVNEKVQDEEFQQQIDGLRGSQQLLAQQIGDVISDNITAQQRGPIDVNSITYLVYAGDIQHVDMYILTPDLHVQKYSIDPDDNTKYDYLAGELPPEDRYEVTEYDMSDLQWSSVVNILTRVNFMELDEDMSTKDTVDDGSTYYIRVETSDATNTSGGYAAGADNDADSRRFAEAREAIERCLSP